MITWITASHDREVFERHLAPSILPAISEYPGDELLVLWDAPDLAAAYTDGDGQARNRIRCYLHHDVEVKHPAVLRALLLEACRPEVGMVGVVGSLTRAVPWWEGQRCGSVVDARCGTLAYTPGGHEATYLDGLLLATCHDVEWDSFGGWHLYDHDACQQMLTRGLQNWCLPGGRDLVAHHTTNPGAIRKLDGWTPAEQAFRTKWGM